MLSLSSVSSRASVSQDPPIAVSAASLGSDDRSTSMFGAQDRPEVGVQSTLESRAGLQSLVTRIADDCNVERSLAVLTLLYRVVAGCVSEPTNPRVASLNVAGKSFACAVGYGPAFEVLDHLGFQPVDGGKYRLNPSLASRQNFEDAVEVITDSLNLIAELRAALSASSSTI